MVRILNKDKSLEDKKISVAIMSSFAILIIQYLILTYFNLIETPNANRIQLLSKIIVAFFYIIALPIVLRRNKIIFIGVYFLSIFIFLLNFLFFNENLTHLKTIIFPFFFTCLPSFVYSYSINEWYVLKDVMRKTSLIVFIIGTIIGGLVFTNKVHIDTYSMSLSYYMLLPTIIYTDDFLEKFNIKSGVIVLISLIIILALGARGPIMCFAVFVILKFINILKNTINYKSILIYMLIIFCLIFILLFYETIVSNMYTFLLQFGINSRTLRLIQMDNLHLSGRDSLYEVVIQEIKNNPLFGIGLAADRRLINTYAHNIIIEILANFGVIMGSAFIILLMFITIKSLFLRNKKVVDMISIWIGIGLVHLFVSSSYLIDFRFWIFLGLVIRNIKVFKIRHKNNF